MHRHLLAVVERVIGQEHPTCEAVLDTATGELIVHVAPSAVDVDPSLELGWIEPVLRDAGILFSRKELQGRPYLQIDGLKSN